MAQAHASTPVYNDDGVLWDVPHRDSVIRRSLGTLDSPGSVNVSSTVFELGNHIANFSPTAFEETLNSGNYRLLDQALLKDANAFLRTCNLPTLSDAPNRLCEVLTFNAAGGLPPKLFVTPRRSDDWRLADVNVTGRQLAEQMLIAVRNHASTIRSAKREVVAAVATFIPEMFLQLVNEPGRQRFGFRSLLDYTSEDPFDGWMHTRSAFVRKFKQIWACHPGDPIVQVFIQNARQLENLGDYLPTVGQDQPRAISISLGYKRPRDSRDKNPFLVSLCFPNRVVVHIPIALLRSTTNDWTPLAGKLLFAWGDPRAVRLYASEAERATLIGMSGTPPPPCNTTGVTTTTTQWLSCIPVLEKLLLIIEELRVEHKDDCTDISVEVLVAAAWQLFSGQTLKWPIGSKHTPIDTVEVQVNDAWFANASSPVPRDLQAILETQGYRAQTILDLFIFACWNSIRSPVARPIEAVDHFRSIGDDGGTGFLPTHQLDVVGHRLSHRYPPKQLRRASNAFCECNQNLAPSDPQLNWLEDLVVTYLGRVLYRLLTDRSLTTWAWPQRGGMPTTGPQWCRWLQELRDVWSFSSAAIRILQRLREIVPCVLTSMLASYLAAGSRATPKMLIVLLPQIFQYVNWLFLMLIRSDEPSMETMMSVHIRALWRELKIARSVTPADGGPPTLVVALDLEQNRVFGSTDAPLSALRWKLAEPLSPTLLSYTHCFLEWMNYARFQQHPDIAYKPQPHPLLPADAYTRATFLLWPGPAPYRYDEPELEFDEDLSNHQFRGLPRIDHAAVYGDVRARLEAVGEGRLYDATPLATVLDFSARTKSCGPVPMASIHNVSTHPLLRWQVPTVPWASPRSDFGRMHVGVPPLRTLNSRSWSFLNHGRGAWDTVAASEGVFYLMPLCAGTLSPLLACMHILRQTHAPSADFPARLLATACAMANVEWLDVVTGRAEVPRRCWLSTLAIHYGIPTVLLYSENSTPPNAFGVYGQGTQTALHCQCAVVVVVGNDWFVHDIEFGQVRCVFPRGRCTDLIETHILDEANLPEADTARVSRNYGDIAAYNGEPPQADTVEWKTWVLVCQLNGIYYGWTTPPVDRLLPTLAADMCPLEKALFDLQVQGAQPDEIEALNYFHAVIMHVGLVGTRLARPEQPADIGATPLASPFCYFYDETSRLAVHIICGWCPREWTSRAIERNMRIFQPYSERPLPPGIPAKSTLDRIISGQQLAYELREQYFALLLGAPACEPQGRVQFGASLPYQLARTQPVLSFDQILQVLHSVRSQIAPPEPQEPLRFDVIHNAEHSLMRRAEGQDPSADPIEEVRTSGTPEGNPVHIWLTKKYKFHGCFDDGLPVEDVAGFQGAQYRSAPNRLVNFFFDPHKRPFTQLASGVRTWDVGLVEPRALPAPDDPRRRILNPDESADEGMSSAAPSVVGQLEIVVPMEVAAGEEQSDAGVSADHVPDSWSQEVEAANRAEGTYRLRIVPLQPVCNQLAKEVFECAIDDRIRAVAGTLLGHDDSGDKERLDALGFSKTAVWSSFGLVEPLEPAAYLVPELGDDPFDGFGPIPVRDAYVPPAALIQPDGEVQVAPVNPAVNSFHTHEQGRQFFREQNVPYIRLETGLVLGIMNSTPYFYCEVPIESRMIDVWRREAWLPMAQHWDDLLPGHITQLFSIFRRYYAATMQGEDVRPFFNLETKQLQLVRNAGLPPAVPGEAELNYWLANAFGPAERARLVAVARVRGHYDPDWSPRHPLRRPMSEWLQPEPTYAPGWERLHIESVPLPLRPLYVEMLMSLSLDESRYTSNAGRTLRFFLDNSSDKPPLTLEVPVPPNVFSDLEEVRPVLPIGHRYFSGGVNTTLTRCILNWLSFWRNQRELLRVLVLSNEQWAAYRARFPEAPRTWARWQNRPQQADLNQLRAMLEETQDEFTAFLLRAKIVCATVKRPSDLVLQPVLHTSLGRWLDFRLYILRLLALDGSPGLGRPDVHAGVGTISIGDYHAYLFFSGDSPLGNFFSAPIPLMGDLYVPSSEHLYHVLQLIFSGDHDLIVPLLRHSEPKRCKSQMTSWRREGRIAGWKLKQREWHNCGLAVAAMHAVLRLKLATCPAYRNALANNPDSIFIEASPFDPFWGIEQGMSDRTLWTSVERWGDNWLGRLHMTMAEQLAREPVQRPWPVLSLNELAMSILAKCRGAVQRPRPLQPLPTVLVDRIARCRAVRRYDPGEIPPTIMTVSFVQGQDPTIASGAQVELGQRPIPQLAVIEREHNLPRGANKAARRMHRLRQARTK